MWYKGWEDLKDAAAQIVKKIKSFNVKMSSTISALSSSEAVHSQAPSLSFSPSKRVIDQSAEVMSSEVHNWLLKEVWNTPVLSLTCHNSVRLLLIFSISFSSLHVGFRDWTTTSISLWIMVWCVCRTFYNSRCKMLKNFSLM